MRGNSCCPFTGPYLLDFGNDLEVIWWDERRYDAIEFIKNNGGGWKRYLPSVGTVTYSNSR